MKQILRSILLQLNRKIVVSCSAKVNIRGLVGVVKLWRNPHPKIMLCSGWSVRLGTIRDGGLEQYSPVVCAHSYDEL